MSDYEQEYGEISDVERHTKKQPSATAIIINLYDTVYPIVRQVSQNFLKWRVTLEADFHDWDVYWTDSGVAPETLQKMKSHQKINHFPGMQILSRKNTLGRQLTKMKRRYPNEYNFFPQSWMLPGDLNEFREYCKQKQRVFIVKPEAGCQGRGIFLSRGSELSERCVVQKYITQPYLIDGLKFDFRIYVLLAGCSPLRVFIYTEGLARFATVPYEQPNADNAEDMCMHLTNYAINKNNENFIFNSDEHRMDIGHKRSMSSVFELLKSENHDIDYLWMQIKQIVIKSLCAGQPQLSHQYNTAQPNNYMNNMCFEILGFDIMIDHKLKPYLIEINHSPSFTTDSPLDVYIKSNLIQDSLVLMNVTPLEKQRLIQHKNLETKKRIMTGKSIKYTQIDKTKIIQQMQAQRDLYEDNHMGGFEKIYPCEEPQETIYFQKFLDYAQEIFEDSTGTKKLSNIKKVVIQATPLKVPDKNKEIQQIYQKASIFLQSTFNKTSQKFNQKQQQQQSTEDKFQKAQLAYKTHIQQQILLEQKKIEQLIRSRNEKNSVSFQSKRQISKSPCESANVKYRSQNQNQ